MTRAVHDRGGWATDAPIDRSEHELADWEILMDALENALEARGVMNTDEMRRGTESMPLAVYGGKREIMRCIAPLGPV